MNAGKDSIDKNVEEQTVTGKRKALKKGFFTIFLEVFAVICVLVVLGIGICMWRINSAPVDVSFIKSSVQNALHDESGTIQVDFSKVLLHWPDFKGPLLLGLGDGRVYNQDGDLVLAVDSAALSLNKGKLFMGQISPEGLILKKPAVLVRRSADNQFSIGLNSQSDVLSEEEELASRSQDVSLDAIFHALRGEEVPSDSPSNSVLGRLSQLNLIRVEDARVMVEDGVLERSWAFPRVDVSVKREAHGMDMDFDVALPRLSAVDGVVPADITDDTVKPRAAGDAFFDWNENNIKLQVELGDFHPWFVSHKIPELSYLGEHDMRVDAKMSAVLSSDLVLQQAGLAVVSEAGALRVPEFNPDEPLKYQNLAFEVSFDSEDRVFSIDRFVAALYGVEVSAAASVHFDGNRSFNVMTMSSITDDGFDVQGEVKIPDLSIDQLRSLWPQSVTDETAREWVFEKIMQGALSDVRFSFAGQSGTDLSGAPQTRVQDVDVENLIEDVKEEEDSDPSFSLNLSELSVGFDFQDADVKYKKSLEPVLGGAGDMLFDLKSDTIRIGVDQGRILDLDVASSSILLDDVMKVGAGGIDLSLNLKGPLKSVLRYLKNEPMRVDLGMNLDAVEGRVDSKVKLRLPTSDDVLMKDIKLTAEGTVSDVYLPNVVRGMPLSGGPLNLTMKDYKVAVTGQAKLDSYDVNVDYQSFITSKTSLTGADYTTQIKAKVTAGEALRDKFGIDLADFLEGPAALDLTYVEKRDGSTTVDVTADITQSRFFLEPFAYEKPVGATGDLSLTAHLRDETLTRVTGLTVRAPDVEMAPSTLAFRQTDSDGVEVAGGKIPQFRVGETTGQLDFEIQDSGLMKIILDGAFLDLRPFLKDDKKKDEPYTNPPMQISVTADTMRTSDDDVITSGKIYADINKSGNFNQLELDAVAGGQDTGSGVIYMRYKPDETGTRAFRFEADDAGAALRAFEVYNNIRGGKLVIYGTAPGGVYDRNISGQAQISDFRVVRAPSLARLLGALSLTGVSELLTGEGLAFSKLESDFNWLFRPSGSLLVLRNGRTSGNALGLTFEGTFDNAKNLIDVKGTIVPLSGVSGMIGEIPLVGQILTGGGGVFAATYSIKGENNKEAGKEPSVSVNPLSVLAPGILRRILFE